MSALAQYAVGKGYKVSGSDRYFANGVKNTRREQLEALGINCFPQDTSGIAADIDTVVISTAIESDVPEYVKVKEMGINVIMRSDMLAEICNSQNTIAVSGTSGKSTVTAMIYQILEYADFSPSLITGAGLISLQKTGKIGNAVAGNSNILVTEVDESDGSIVKYKPQTGLILNIEKDHKSIEELNDIFGQFAKNVKSELIVNKDNAGSAKFSTGSDFDFLEGYLTPKDIEETIEGIKFKLKTTNFKINIIGKHNAENAVAAVAVALKLKIPIETATAALGKYEGIYRRHQILGVVSGVTVIDDYAHNPAKLAASLRACQALSNRVLLWFQPHGYGPTRFLRSEFVKELSETARKEDTVIFSEIYYAGGTADKSISAEDLINDLQKKGTNAVFLKNRENIPEFVHSNANKGDILLLCGARDPSLNGFAQEIFDKLKLAEKSN